MGEVLGFWDVFVQRVIASFFPASPPENEYPGQVIACAFQHKRFRFDELSDGSVLLMLIQCGDNPVIGPPLRIEAQLRIGRLSEREIGSSLVLTCPYDVSRLAEAGAGGGVLQRSLLAAAVTRLFSRDADRFVARLWLTKSAPDWASVWVRTAVWEWDTLTAVETRGDIKPWVYRAILRTIQLLDVPNDWPEPPPSWGACITKDEKSFLKSALRLSINERCLVYLCLYAGMDAQQISVAMEGSTPPAEPATIAARLRSAWLNLLDKWQV